MDNSDCNRKMYCAQLHKLMLSKKADTWQHNALIEPSLIKSFKNGGNKCCQPRNIIGTAIKY